MRCPRPVFNIHKPTGLKLLTRLRPGMCHLNESKCNHSFKNCVNPLCSFSLQVETASHTSCTVIISHIHKNLFNELQSVDEDILNHSGNETTSYGSNKYKFQQNCSTLKSSIKFTVKSERFRGSLL